MRLAPLALSLFVVVTAAAAPAEIDRAAAAIAGREAAFTQRFTPKGFKNAQVESGSVLFGSLPMMRWSYTSPEQKLFVFDGTHSWFYVPADRQVTVGQIDEAGRRALPLLLLGDATARDLYFVVREQRRGSSVITTLQPKDKSPAVRDITVTSGAADHLITRIEYSDREGNRTVFDLTGYHPRSADGDSFRFVPPPGTQIINTQ